MLNAIELEADIDLDEISIEIEPIESKDVEIDTDEDEEEIDEDEYEDEDEDEDEEIPVKKIRKTPIPKKEKKERVEIVTTKRIPQIGQVYKANNFTIEIIGKSRSLSLCKVITTQSPSLHILGETFEAEEIAFYSDYYQLVGY